MDIIRLALIGFGNVGQGFLNVLIKNRKVIQSFYGIEIKLIYIVDPVKGSAFHRNGLDLEDIQSFFNKHGSLKPYKFSVEINSLDVVKDGDVDVVVEVTPTNLKDGEPGYSHIKRSLENGKHVITTNKGPLALYFKELTGLAREKGLYLGFEGTVMSGTPLIKTLKHGLLNDILKIVGILNGTTNFILTKMEDGYSFEEALKNAQEMGYAEADPSMDIDGYDLVAKASILANIVTDEEVKPKDIYRISLKEYLSSEGYKKDLKYLVNLDFTNRKYSVIPKPLEKNSILLSVRGVNNGVLIETESLGSLFIYGPGAGRKETGYAILSDLIELIKIFSKRHMD